MDRTGSPAIIPYLECGVSIRTAVPIPVCLLGGRQFLKVAEKLIAVLGGGAGSRCYNFTPEVSTEKMDHRY